MGTAAELQVGDPAEPSRRREWRNELAGRSVLTLFPEMFPGPLGAIPRGAGAGGRGSGRWGRMTSGISQATDRHRRSGRHAVRGRGGDGDAGRYRGWTGRSRRIDDGRPLVLPDAARGAADAGAMVARAGRGARGGAALRAVRGRGRAGGGGIAGCEEISVGDYVLSGGEPAALVLLDACVRLLPGVMGAAASADGGEFCRWAAGISAVSPGRRSGRGARVPEVLLSGNHAAGGPAGGGGRPSGLTRERRPDLWAAYRASQTTGMRRRTDGCHRSGSLPRRAIRRRRKSSR